MLDPLLLPHFLFSRASVAQVGALAGPLLGVQARCKAPLQTVNTNCPSRTVLKTGPLIVSLMLFQQSDPEGLLPSAQESLTTHPGQKSLGTDSGWLLPQIFMSAGDK